MNKNMITEFLESVESSMKIAEDKILQERMLKVEAIEKIDVLIDQAERLARNQDHWCVKGDVGTCFTCDLPDYLREVRATLNRNMISG